MKKPVQVFADRIQQHIDEKKFFEPKKTIAIKRQNDPSVSLSPALLDVVREVITFWKTNKEHIYIPNYRDGLFKITQPTEVEMAEFAR